MKKLLMVFITAASLIACKNNEEKTTTSTFDLEKVKVEIAASNKTYGDGFAKGDSAAFISHYTKDGCIMPANAPKLCGAGAIAMFFKGAQGMGVKAVNLVTEEVMGGSEVVVETGTYELVGDASKSLDKGKFVVAWKQEDGKWKMHRDMFTTSAAAAGK
jgi:ketosteroid isomerase-like protein